jgi:glycosyltransferase involved in cell wall biosynthesis
MEIMKNKLVRITTVPLSLDLLLSGQLNYMKSFYEVTAVSSDGDYLKKIGSKENVKTFTIEMSRKITPMHDLVAVVKLFIFLKKERPLIVHSHTPKAGVLSMIASKCAGVPIRLHTVGGLPLMETKGFKRNILESVEKLTYSCATMVYPNSKGLYDFIVANKFTHQGKLKIISNGSTNGINTNHFAPEQVSKSLQEILKIKLEIQKEDFVFVYVGRLVGDKGINEVVQAFKKIIKKNLSVKLLLVGMYEKDLDPLDELTHEEINSNKNILFAGFQKDIRPYLAISNALVFPSYREGFPNVVLQAGAMGLPSIVSDINGCNEIIIDGKNGIIIPVKNSQAIEKAVLRMIYEKDFFISLKSNARHMITSRFDQNLIWESILEEYEQVEKKQQKLLKKKVYNKGIKPWKTKFKFNHWYSKNQSFGLNIKNNSKTIVKKLKK